jgi:hypothetical protein
MELVEKSPLEEEGVFVSIYQLRYKYMYEISVTRPCPLLGLVEHPEPAIIRLKHKSERPALHASNMWSPRPRRVRLAERAI